MFCAFFTLLILCGGAGAVIWLGWRRLATHLNKDETAKKYFFEHIIAPVLLGQKEPKAEDKPIVKKTRGTLL